MDLEIHYDAEASVWCARYDELSIVLESEEYDELIQKIRSAVPEMAELNHQVSIIREEGWTVATDVATGIASQGRDSREALKNL